MKALRALPDFPGELMKELKKAYVLDERSRDPDLQPIIRKPKHVYTNTITKNPTERSYRRN